MGTAVRTALGEAGIEAGAIARCVSTGYGRRMLDIADRPITIAAAISAA